MLGLTNDARVHISAPGIDVVITGDTEQVRALLGVVKHELERSAARRELAVGRKKSVRSSQYVRPTELDEMDSPYVLPEAMVVPVEDTSAELMRTPVDEETVDEPKRRLPTLPAARAEVRVTRAGDDAPTAEVNARAFQEQAATLIPEIRPNGKDPSGPVFVPDTEQPFVTDGGPTLTPSSDLTADVTGTDPEVKEIDSDHGV